MKYLDDKMFRDLSVTAHKWLPITEVGLSDDVNLLVLGKSAVKKNHYFI